MMKKLLVASTLLISSSALADAPGSQTCGWGNMLFAGQSGTPSHVLAATTNASTGNNTIGMTFGTNGCSTKGTLTYGGKEMIDVSMIMDEFSEDVARGDGEALTAVAVSLGVEEASSTPSETATAVKASPSPRATSSLNSSIIMLTSIISLPP